MKVIKTKKNYFYKVYKNGKKIRISKIEYNKLRKFNLKVKELKKIIKDDDYAYPEALKYVEKYIKKYDKKMYKMSEIAMVIYEDEFD
jgi:hypothetical protein|tara:strand:- start:141 stop:401 length:261 start_codon:yes stop_codon:yes gene_type:complete